jgi:NADH-quinone oxidoreductase subunit L
VVRAFPLFEASGVALTVTLVIGLTTALAAGLMACVQHDIKKVLAYSTISQLGYMFIALGAGGATAGLYHLVTHAYFKSLLFLGAGVIIHAAHTQDMREMGGLARYLPKTTLAFTAGSLALAGVFPLSGFWSKDEILTVLYHEHHYVALGLALLTAFITAFYVARLWFRVFAGPAQSEDIHEAHWSMLLPMGMLATITLAIGFFGPALGEFLGHEIPLPELPMAVASTGVASSGLAIGWFVYGRSTKVINTRAIKQRARHAYGIFANKLYLDLTYDYFIVKPYGRLAQALAAFDATVIDGAVNGAGAMWRRFASGGWTFDSTVIDGLVNGTAAVVKEAGASLRRIQTGRVRAYQTFVVGAIVLLMVWVLVKGA